MDPEALQEGRDALSLPATTTVYYSDGTTVMARLGSQNRSLVRMQSLPDHVADAVIANGYRLDDLIQRVVSSYPFLHRHTIK